MYVDIHMYIVYICTYIYTTIMCNVKILLYIIIHVCISFLTIQCFPIAYIVLETWFNFGLIRSKKQAEFEAELNANGYH